MDKKLCLKRLLIFLFLTFSISWSAAVILNRLFGYHTWFETNKVPIFFLFVGYAPAAANILTRLITKEGFNDPLLHLNIKGNIKYYLIAWLIIGIMSIPNAVLSAFLYGDWSEFGSNMEVGEYISTVLIVLVTGPLFAFNTIGEEYGWRGYMNQHMEPLLGTVGTVITGGIIWGAWHAVLTVEGHNFGTDYPGYPYAGIGFMCIICTFEGMILMWLTRKSGSIYPAAIMHAMNNIGIDLVGHIFEPGVAENTVFSFSQSFIHTIPQCLISTVFLMLMVKEDRKSSSP